MSDAARAVFGAHAEGYDAERRRLLPCFDAFCLWRDGRFAVLVARAPA